MMEKQYQNACFDLQTSVDEALSVLSLLLDGIERETDSQTNGTPENRLLLAQALILRVQDTYLPALRMIEAHLTAANTKALHALTQQQQ